MATNAQKRTLQLSTNNVNTSMTEKAASQAAYNAAKNNYSNLANKGYTQSNNTKVQYTNYNKTMEAAKAVLGKGVNYTNKYTPKIESLLDRAENGKMNYSVTDDPAYKALQNTYVNQGRVAMQNAVGESVGATGGYGSTVATAAAQAAYNQNLTELNAHVSDLYDKAANRFNNQQNLLVTLADSYREMDAQGWQQAYQEWDSTFNGYMKLADEYLNGYEYMDEADRKAYETKLNAYYNVMSSAQNQYNSDSDRLQQAITQYGNAANDIANYEETVRANAANEAMERAQLEETKRVNKSKITGNAPITQDLAPSAKVTDLIYASKHPNFNGKVYMINGKESIYPRDEWKKIINGDTKIILTASEAQYLMEYYNL